MQGKGIKTCRKVFCGLSGFFGFPAISGSSFACSLIMARMKSGKTIKKVSEDHIAESLVELIKSEI